MPARVLIDATAIPDDRGGVGRYLDGLIEALPATLGDSDVSVTVICRRTDADLYRASGVNVMLAPETTRSAAIRMIWEQVSLPGLVMTGGFDVLHSPHYTFPLFGRFRRVVTVHDLTFFTLPAAHTALKRVLFRFWLRRIARRHLAVIAVSAATAAEFVRILGPATGAITVAPLGFDSTVFRVPSVEERAHFGAGLRPPTDRWVAFLGTLEPRKNVPALIRAHSQLGVDAPPLLIAGGPGWDTEVEDAVAAANTTGSDVRRLGYLPIEQLAPFLGGADVVAYPSLGEGFGLPVLEAMACGAAVLTTERLALPEVGGDAVAYTGVHSEEIAAALAALLGDPVRRADLGRRARDRAAESTWERTARRHLAAYLGADA